MPDEKLVPVRVAVRARPLITKEKNEGCQQVITFIPGEPQLVLGNNKAFSYDFVLSPDDPQVKVYDACCKTLVKGIFKGYNATVLAYGQTGSGKTHTMGGAYDSGAEEADKGIIPRVIRDLFEGISLRQENNDFTVRVSYLEIYNEELVDLLVPASSRVKDAVVIREDTQGIRLNGLTETVVSNQRETTECLEIGSRSRTTGATQMNNTSSRSHAIFTIHIDRTNKTDNNDYFKVKFHLVDLAGSERVKKTMAEGDRFREGVNINKGLLALGNVISALGEDAKVRRHIPYRDAKLTRILQDSLGGNSNTVMIACVSPADINIEETSNTLQYADRARKIKNKPIVNRDPQAAEIMRLKALVQQLQTALGEKGGNLPPGDVSRSSLDSSIDTSVYKEAIAKLEEENGKLKAELVNAIHQNTSMYQKVVNVEAINDQLKEHLEILKSKTGLSLSLLEEHPEMQSKIREIQEHINEMETIHESTMDNTVSTEDTATSDNTTVEHKDGRRSSGINNYTTEDVLKEAQLKNRMYALNDMLDQKEALLKELNSNNVTFNVVHEKFEAELREREVQISDLTKEKDELLGKLNSAKAAMNSTKVSEQRRQRLKECEAKINALTKENREQTKLLKMKESTAKHSQRLEGEIRDLKKQRVNLMKQMRAESEASRKWKQKKEKELLQMKAKERRQQAEFQKLERQNQHQQAVLRRKTEEAAGANRRLKEALMKQKQVREERTNKQARHDINTQNKLKKWLDNELEVVVSFEENRHHLEQLHAERKELTSRITHLKEERALPPTKKKMLNNSDIEETGESKKKLESDIAEAENDLKYLNTQISETQQRIMEADQDDKQKSRWDEVKTIQDARTALRLLLEKAVKAQIERLQEVSKAVDAQADLEEKQEMLSGLQQKIDNLKEEHNRQVTSLHQDAQRRLAPLLSLLNQKVLSQDGLESAHQLTKQELDKLSAVHDELERKTAEVDSLHKKLIKTSIKQRVADTSYFGHLDSTPKLEPRQKKKLEYHDDFDPEIFDTPFTPGVNLDNKVMDPDWKPHASPELKPGLKAARAQRGSKVTSSEETMVDAEVTLDTTVSPTCGCKGDCATKRCKCNKNGDSCTDKCMCRPTICVNREKTEEKENPEDGENTTNLNSTFVMGNATSTPNESLETTEEPEQVQPKRKSSGVKRNSAGVPRVPLGEKGNLKSRLATCESTLDSSDDFMDTSTFGSKRQRQKKPFFKEIS